MKNSDDYNGWIFHLSVVPLTINEKLTVVANSVCLKNQASIVSRTEYSVFDQWMIFVDV